MSRRARTRRDKCAPQPDFDDPIAAHQAYVAAAGQLHSHNPVTS